MKRNKAFSLLEILIGLAIIGLIASIAHPMWKNTKNKANYEVSRLQLTEVAKAMEKHYLEKGKYPVFTDWAQLSSGETPLLEYTTEVPKTDPWGRDYRVIESSEDKYLLEALGVPNKESEYPDFTYQDGLKFKEKGAAS